MLEGLDLDDMAADGLQKSLEQEVRALLKKHRLDSAFLMVTWRTNEEGTRSAAAKAGNYYASLGATKEWMIRQEETERINQRRYLGEKDA